MSGTQDASGLPPLLATYRAATRALSPLAPLLLARRRRRGKEDPVRLPERLGHAGLPRPPGGLVWVHGASVGEIQSVLPLAAALTARGLNVLATSGTVTSAGLAARRLPPGAFHQYVPLDLPGAAARFLDHWRPDLALLAESELWPNLILAAAARDIPLVLVNARLSARSARRWGHARRSIARLTGAFALCLAQDEGVAARLRALGAAEVRAIGNLKHDVPPLPDLPEARTALEQACGPRPLLLAASTHPGEDEIVLAAAAMVRQELPDLLTIIAPRHPARGEAIAAMAAAQGESALRRSGGGLPEPRTSLYVADTIGELGIFYRLARIAFVGGSLVPHGGQNPIEPVKLGAAVLHGPHVANFEDVYRALGAAGGTCAAGDAQALAAAALGLLRDEARRTTQAAAAGRVIEGLSGALGRTLGALEPFLPREVRHERV